MDPRKKIITELSRRIAEQGVEARAQLQRLGEYLASQDGAVFGDPEFREIRGRILELREQLPASRQQVRRIMQCMERNAELEEKLRLVGERFGELERENDGICEEVGRLFYASWQGSPPPAELAELFAKVAGQEQELRALLEDQERSRSGRRSGNLFQMIGSAGKGFFLRSAVNFKRKAVARAYTEAGRELCESEVGGKVSDPALRRRMSPYRENRKKLEELTGEGEALRAAQAELWEELKTLGADKSYQRRVREIERGIQEAEGELEKACLKLGELFRARPVRSFSTDPEVKNRLRRAAQAEKESVKHQERIRRIEAAIQIDVLDAQVRAMRGKIEKLTREIRAREREVRSLQKRIQGSDEDRELLVKVRGPENTLLQVEEIVREPEEEQ